VVSAANTLMRPPSSLITDDVRDRLGLWLLPATAGSFALELACPPPADPPGGSASLAKGLEETLPGQEAETVTSIGLDAVLRVLETATVTNSQADAVERQLGSVGVFGVRSIDRFAARFEAGEFTADFTLFDPRPELARHFTLRTRDAAFIRSVIKNRALDVTYREVVGMLLTASSVRSLFDIVIDSGERFSGTVAPESRPGVVQLFNRRVSARLEERLDPADASGERVSRRLVSLTAVSESDDRIDETTSD